MVCPNCKKELAAGAKFCDGCGTKLPESVVCPSCGAVVPDGAFCQACGASLKPEPVQPEPVQPEPVQPEPVQPEPVQTAPVQPDPVQTAPVQTAPPVETEKKAKKFPLKPVIFGGSGLALLIVIVIVLGSIFTKPAKKDFAMYVKDGEICYTPVSRIKPFEVTDDLFGDAGLSREQIANYSFYMSVFVKMSEDGKTLYYADRLDDSDNGMSIYRRDITKQNKEPEKLDSEILSFSVSDDGKYAVYLKSSDDRDLYRSNIKNKEKIASDVSDYMASADGKTVVFLTKDGDLYYQKAGKGKEKISGDVSSINHINEKFTEIWYRKDDELYKQTIGKDNRTKLDSDVSSVIRIYDSGEAYYTKSDAADIDISDFIDDDMKAADEALKEPEKPVYPSYYDFDDMEEYEKAYEEYQEAYEKYWDDLDLYGEKEERDEIRQELKDALSDDDLDLGFCSLYYYSGKKAVLLSDSVSGSSTGSDFKSLTDKAVIAYNVVDKENGKKVKMSEISDIYEIESLIAKNLRTSASVCIASGDKVSEIDCKTSYYVYFTTDGSAVYYFTEVSDKTSCGELKKAKISGNKVGKSSLVDSDVFTLRVNIIEGGKVVYFKDMGSENSKGDLYIDGNKIDYDVSTGSLGYIESSDMVIYYTDYNSSKNSGTLKKYHGKKAVKIADDVYRFYILPSGNLLYLTDYDNYRGMLYLYKGKKSVKIDDDVSFIIAL